jgi:hypothetical protein
VQWYICDSTDANCAAIAGATAMTYVPVSTDVGGNIQVQETATNAGGSTSAYSTFTGPVTNLETQIPVPAATVRPVISGTAQQGRTLTSSEGSWNGNPGTFGYQWVRCGSKGCVPIPGATNAAYTLSADDVGSAVAVQVTTANGGGNGSPAESAATATVTSPTTTAMSANASALVTDRGVTFVATVTSGTSTAPPAGSLTFLSNGGAIAGCGGVKIQPTGASGTVTCQTAFSAATANIVAAYSPASGSLTTASSSPVTTLVVGRAAPRISVSVSGSTVVHNKLTYTAKILAPAGSTGTATPSGTVQFLDGKRAVSSCATRRLKSTKASCVMTYRGLGSHRIAVIYQGDRNFLPGRSAVKPVTIRPSTPTGFVSALMAWSYRFHPRFSTFTQLVATGLSARMTITIVCQGGGCPFRSHRIVDSAPKRCHGGPPCAAPVSLNLLEALRGAHLRPGARLTIRIAHPGWIGKSYVFVIRSGRRPTLSESCLAVGSSLPGVGCTGTA